MSENIGTDRSPSGWRKPVAALVAGLLIGAGAMALFYQAGFADPERARTEEIVRDYLLKHPEIIPEAMQRLEARHVAQAVEQYRKALETPFAGSWAGAADADVVLVEFFDYACSYCRRSNPDIDRLLTEDRKLKIVWRELPVLGPASQAAAEASLAAAKEGKFKAFYDKLYALGRPDMAKIAAARQAAGVKGRIAANEARTEIEKNMELARAVGASGTPTFVVGNRVLQGAVGYEALKDAIAEARGR